MLDRVLGLRFVGIALGHVGREYPNKLDHVMSGPEDVRPPRALHPIFYGSFDWHSCVHAHWLLARLRRRFPGTAEADAVGALFDAQFREENVAAEVAYLRAPGARGFERPYGWAWALMLQGELERHRDAAGRRWAERVRPLAAEFVRRFEAFLPLCTYPVRAGVHSNTAFALLLARAYAAACGDAAFAAVCAASARRWYGGDRHYRALEPSQDEFLSPTLIEAALMRDVLPPAEFRDWLAQFLPAPGDDALERLLTPARVSDRSDGKIAHLDGLHLSRAWCWRLLADAFAPGDPLATRIRPAIDAHLDAGLAHVAGDYMGEHWLASFALLALDPHLG